LRGAARAKVTWPDRCQFGCCSRRTAPLDLIFAERGTEKISSLGSLRPRLRRTSKVLRESHPTTVVSTEVSGDLRAERAWWEWLIPKKLCRSASVFGGALTRRRFLTKHCGRKRLREDVSTFRAENAQQNTERRKRTSTE
jgi:hypothetical protein